MCKKTHPAVLCFCIVMLLFVVFIAWYLPSVGALRFQLEDVQKSLETSRGREKKQQIEYDETVEAIPTAQSELDRLLPLAEEASQSVKSLKDERKILRNEKKELENQLESKQFAEE